MRGFGGRGAVALLRDQSLSGAGSSLVTSLTGSLKQALTAFGPGFANNLDIADNLTTLGSNILGAVPFGWINWIGQDGSDLTFQYAAIAGGVLSGLSPGAQD